MMNLLDRLPSALVLTALSTVLVACGGEEEVVQAPAPRPKPVVTQTEPEVIEVKQLNGECGFDASAEFDEQPSEVDSAATYSSGARSFLTRVTDMLQLSVLRAGVVAQWCS